jgi:hypothetical protein
LIIEQKACLKKKNLFKVRLRVTLQKEAEKYAGIKPFDSGFFYAKASLSYYS